MKNKILMKEVICFAQVPSLVNYLENNISKILFPVIRLHAGIHKESFNLNIVAYLKFNLPYLNIILIYC